MKKTRTDIFKNYSIAPDSPACSFEMTIEKLVLLETLDRIGVIEDYTNVIKFYHPETGQVMGKDLVIQNDEYQHINVSKAGFMYRGPRRVIANNAIFLSEPEYNVLVTSCNDGTIRS